MTVSAFLPSGQLRRSLIVLSALTCCRITDADATVIRSASRSRSRLERLVISLGSVASLSVDPVEQLAGAVGRPAPAFDERAEAVGRLVKKA